MKKKQESLLDLIRGAHDAWSGAAIKAFCDRNGEKCFLMEIAVIILLRMGVCAFGGTYVRGHGRSDRHWCNLADGPQVWDLSHCLLPQHGAVLLE